VIGGFSKAPTFMVRDPSIGRRDGRSPLFELFRREKQPNEFVFEFIFPDGDEVFER
jgi:hypothetical protein